MIHYVSWLITLVSAHVPLRSVGLPTKSPRGFGYNDMTWDKWKHTCLLTVAPVRASRRTLQYVQQLSCPANTSISSREGAYDLYHHRSHHQDCEAAAGPWAPWTSPAFHVCYAIAVANLTKMEPGDRVLDLGSGCGYKLQMWSEWLHIRGVGLDYMPLHTRSAKRLFELNKSPIQACTGTISNLSWIPSDSMDIVHSMAVFMYLRQEWMKTCRIILEIYRILKQNGIFILTWQFRYFSGKELKECMKGVRGAEVVILNESNVFSEGEKKKEILIVYKTASRRTRL